MNKAMQIKSDTARELGGRYNSAASVGDATLADLAKLATGKTLPLYLRESFQEGAIADELDREPAPGIEVVPGESDKAYDKRMSDNLAKHRETIRSRVAQRISRAMKKLKAVHGIESAKKAQGQANTAKAAIKKASKAIEQAEQAGADTADLAESLAGIKAGKATAKAAEQAGAIAEKATALIPEQPTEGKGADERPALDTSKAGQQAALDVLMASVAARKDSDGRTAALDSIESLAAFLKLDTGIK